MADSSYQWQDDAICVLFSGDIVAAVSMVGLILVGVETQDIINARNIAITTRISVRFR